MESCACWIRLLVRGWLEVTRLPLLCDGAQTRVLPLLLQLGFLLLLGILCLLLMLLSCWVWCCASVLCPPLAWTGANRQSAFKGLHFSLLGRAVNIHFLAISHWRHELPHVLLGGLFKLIWDPGTAAKT